MIYTLVIDTIFCSESVFQKNMLETFSRGRAARFRQTKKINTMLRNMFQNRFQKNSQFNLQNKIQNSFQKHVCTNLQQLHSQQHWHEGDQVMLGGQVEGHSMGGQGAPIVSSVHCKSHRIVFLFNCFC